MNDPWTDRLSEYLDGELLPGDAELLESAPAGLRRMHRHLADLKRVAVRARALDDREPGADLWPGIATRIGATTPSSGVPAIASRAGRAAAGASRSPSSPPPASP